MNWRNFLIPLITLLLLFGFAAFPQLPAPPKPPKPQFFAGQVVEADAAHVKVSRLLVGRAPETRVFALDAKTKTPKGGIKPKTRVTVRYEHQAERDLALEIQVRLATRTAKTT